MNKKELEEKMADLLLGRISRAEEEEILKEINDSGFSVKELESLLKVSKFLNETPLQEPSDRMDKRFYALLEDEKRRILLGDPEIRHQNSFLFFLKGPGLRIAAGIALFLLGWFTSFWFGGATERTQVNVLAEEVKGLRETLVLTMMQQSSPVERIKAVSMVSEFKDADKQIITGLLRLLNSDSNDNVRLLALEELTRYSSVNEVREGLINSISNQKSPMIQIRLAEVMLFLNEKRAVPEFQRILQDDGLNYSVRGKMNDAIVILL